MITHYILEEWDNSASLLQKPEEKPVPMPLFQLWFYSGYLYLMQVPLGRLSQVPDIWWVYLFQIGKLVKVLSVSTLIMIFSVSPSECQDNTF
jgi:hypothetical protein